MSFVKTQSVVESDAVAEIRQQFERRFGCRVDVWIGPEWTVPPRANSDERATVKLIWNEQAVRISETPRGTTLWTPLWADDCPVVIALRRSFSDPDLAIQLADSLVEEAAAVTRIQRLESEADSFARQVTADFEELTFLRRIPEVLDVAGNTQDLLSVAEPVLHSLRLLIEAQGVAIFPSDESSPFASNQKPVTWLGAPQLETQDVQALIERFGEQAIHLPFVQNYVQRKGDSQLPSSLHEFILVPIRKSDRLMGWLLAANRETSLTAEERSHADDWQLVALEFGTIEATLLASTAAILATHASNVEHLVEKEELLIKMVRVLVSAIEAKDRYTCGHSERVALYAQRIASQLGFSAESCERLYLAGLLHDIGKIGISDAVLTKPALLTDEEFAEIQTHPDKGWTILQGLRQLDYVIPGVLYHHERVDGQGYPDRLQGNEIPWDGRILAVADAYDAMTSDRPYRKGMAQSKAEAILRQGAGTHWDVRVIDAIFEAMDDILEIRSSYVQQSDVSRTAAATRNQATAILEEAPSSGSTA